MSRTASFVLLSSLIPTLLLTGCFLRNPLTDGFPEPPPVESLPSIPSGASLDVLVLGDWGTGGEGQRTLAESIARTHAEVPPAFVLTVGDNFYPDGVTGAQDPMWNSHFETVYTGPFWESMVFQATLGNHDHYGAPDAQIEYSTVSPRWDMPARYYAFERDVPGGGSALFLALDTEPISREEGEAARVQVEWADSVLDGSTADWIVAVGHHPAETAGWHEPNKEVREALWPILAGRTQVYVSGHNHSTELLETNIRTLQAVCGGGGGLDNPHRVGTTDRTLASFTNGGWCMLRFWSDTMAIDLHDREGGIQFRYVIGG
jgi:tartrate-resistant acid phosphatase type 5